MNWSQVITAGVDALGHVVRVTPVAMVVGGALVSGYWWRVCQERAAQMKELEVTLVEREIELAWARRGQPWPTPKP